VITYPEVTVDGVTLSWRGHAPDGGVILIVGPISSPYRMGIGLWLFRWLVPFWWREEVGKWCRRFVREPKFDHGPLYEAFEEKYGRPVDRW